VAVQDITSGVWWTKLWPGFAIATLVTALTLVGEGLNDVINPLLRARGAAGAKLDAAAATDLSASAAEEAAPGGQAPTLPGGAAAADPAAEASGHAAGSDPGGGAWAGDRHGDEEQP
jgi:hypothetical protein